MMAGTGSPGKPINYHGYIRNLVVDGQMSYESVLDLTVTQISALLTEKSLSPGQVDPNFYSKISEAN